MINNPQFVDWIDKLIDMQQIYWNYIVAFYLFTAGVSAGAFIVSVVADFLGGRRYERIARIGAYIAPFPVILGLFALVLDLERPFHFWWLFLTFQVDSAMSWGSWLLLFFCIFSFIYLFLWIPDKFIRIFNFIPDKYDYLKIKDKTNAFLNRLPGLNISRYRGIIGGIGLPISMGIAIYTGILLCYPIARPFWNTPMLPMIFFLSAILDGAAAVCFIGLFLHSKAMDREEIDNFKFLIHSFHFVLLIFTFIGVVLFIAGMYFGSVESTEAVKVIMGGPYTFSFWFWVVLIGLIIPFIVEVYELMPHYFAFCELKEHKPWLSGLTASFILSGGFMLRYVVLYAGQMTKAISI